MRRAGVLIAAARARRLRRRRRRHPADARRAARAGRRGAAAGGQRPRAGADPGAAPAGARAQRRRPTACGSHFKHPPRCGLLFDLDTGRVLWRRDPTRVLPIAWLTKMMTALIVVDRAPPDAKVRVTKEALAYKGSGVGVLPKGKRIGSRRCCTGCCCRRATTRRSRSPSASSGTVAALRAAHERAAPATSGWPARASRSPDGFQDGGNHSCADRPRRDRARGARPAAPGAHRRAAGAPCCRSRSRAAGCTSTTTTRCCARATPARSGSRPATPTPPAAAWWPPRGAGRRLGVVLLHSPDPGKQARQLLDRGFAAES